MCVESFHQLHDEGLEWVYTPDLAQRAASLDETYVARRETVNRFLGFIGVNRPAIPYFPHAGAIYVALSRLEDNGKIEGRFEDREPPRRRVYRLIPAEQPSEE